MALTSNYSVSDFLKVYGGEVLKAFNHECLVKDRLRNRTIASGKSATFPTLAVEEAKLHTPGDDLFGASPDFASDATPSEQVINIDKLLIAPQFVDDLDEAMNHYDTRSELAAQAGMALATAHERWSIAALGKGAGAAVTTTGSFAAITGAMVKDAIEQAAQEMDENKVPREGRALVLPPSEFYLLMKEDDVVSSDFGRGGDRAAGGAGKLFYMGFEILNSSVMNEFRDTTAAEQKAASGPLNFGGTTQRTDLSSDLQLCFGVAFQKEAAGTVTLKGMQTEANYIPERQGNLLVAKMAVGVDILRPEAAFRLITSAA